MCWCLNSWHFELLVSCFPILPCLFLLQCGNVVPGCTCIPVGVKQQFTLKILTDWRCVFVSCNLQPTCLWISVGSYCKWARLLWCSQPIKVAKVTTVYSSHWVSDANTCRIRFTPDSAVFHTHRTVTVRLPKITALVFPFMGCVCWN